MFAQLRKTLADSERHECYGLDSLESFLRKHK